MIIKSLHIISFGGLRDCVIDLSDGVNIISGANEAGKTSAAMFLKFVFYGLSSKATKSGGASERMRFINRETMQAAGYITATGDDGCEYRIERALIASDNSTPRERIRIMNQTTGKTVSGQNPGEYFFGVPENVYLGTAFVGQNRPVKPDIAGEGGAKGSVENLLTSADENVDIKRAVKKLDAVRRELCHKNGAGGEISELKEKRASLKNERDSSASRAAEILSVSASAADIRNRIAELEETGAKQARIFAALDKLDKKRRFDVLDSTNRTIADISESVRMIDGSPLGGDFSEKLHSAEREIRAYDEKKAAFDEKRDTLPEANEPDELPNGDEAIKTAVKTEKSARLLFALGLASVIGGIIALLASVGLYLLNTGRYGIVLGIAVLLALIGALFIIIRGGVARKLGDILGEWGAESVEDMPSAVEERINRLEKEKALIEKKRSLTDSLEAAEKRKNLAVETVSSLAETVGIGCGNDVYAVLRELHDTLKKAMTEREALVTRSDKLKGRLEILSEQLEGLEREKVMREAAEVLATQDGAYAAKMTQDDIKALVKQREFDGNALRSAIKRKEALDERLAELGKLNRTPDELDTLVKSLDERIAELSLRHDACELAQTALTKAGEAMRSGVVPRLGRRAADFMGYATGKYDRLTVDSTFSCGLGEGDDMKTSELFSRGTADLAYIALRIALAEEVFRADRPTVVLDESFAHVDGERLGKMMKMLSESDGQYIVLTCREDETDAAQKLGGNVIKLFPKGTF